jgi:hypothetical protein
MRLPNSAQEFERVIGRDDTLKLAELATNKRGRIYVPTNPMSDDHPIVQAIGRDAATTLQKAFAGSLMRLASCRVFKRSRDIASGWIQGYSMRELSQRFQVTERTTYSALTRITSAELDRGPMPLANRSPRAGQQEMRSQPPPGIGSSEGVPCG